MMAILTPEKVEARLVSLSKEIDNAHADLVDAEKRYHEAKTAYELGIARVRLSYRGVDTKMRVQEVEDTALIENAAKFVELNEAEVMVKAARANATRLRIQVEIARSVGTSVRASYEAG
jgi:hypothetical protein